MQKDRRTPFVDVDEGGNIHCEMVDLDDPPYPHRLKYTLSDTGMLVHDHNKVWLVAEIVQRRARETEA